MVHRSKIDLKDVPEDWRPVEELRRKTDLSMEELAELLDISYQTYHNRTSGKTGGRYSDAFCALAGKVYRLYRQGLSINAKKSFAIKYVRSNLDNPEGEAHGPSNSDGDVQPVPGSIPSAGDEGTVHVKAEGGNEGDRGEEG